MVHLLFDDGLTNGSRKRRQKGEEVVSGEGGPPQMRKRDSGTETVTRGQVDIELEFLKKKKQKREKLCQFENHPRPAGVNKAPRVKPTFFNGLRGTLVVDRRKLCRSPGKLEHSKTPSPQLPNSTAAIIQKVAKTNGIRGGTDIDTENDCEAQTDIHRVKNSPTSAPSHVSLSLPQTKSPQPNKEQRQKQQSNEQEKQTPPKLKPNKHNGKVPTALLEHRRKLPIWGYRSLLQEALCERDILIMLGETGSGKSTQVVQFLLNQPWMKPDQVDGQKVPAPCLAITQPRRIAATSLAMRVAQELGVRLGEDVGYSVRFDNRSDPYKTRIKFLTDGMLLREMLEDPQLTRYRAVLVDEAHERTVNGDLILGFLKGLVKNGGVRSRGRVEKQAYQGQRFMHNLKVIIMSATVDVEKFAHFFEVPRSSSHTETEPVGTVGICHIEGRQYPVETIYTRTPVDDYVEAALRTVYQIHLAEPLPGDVLVFLPGQDDIEALDRLITEYSRDLDLNIVPQILPLQLYASLPHNLQQRVFNPAPSPRTRKIIIATNIAETSITVPGVRYVIDSGKAKTRQFRPKIGLESLLVTEISKSSAAQRKGRAGREAPGKCYRLYTESTYTSLAENSVPEILRVDVASSVLTMKASGQNEILDFDFLDSPSRDSLVKALEQLYSLGALDNTGAITSLGKMMAKLPLSPNPAKVLISALEPCNIDILPEVVDIISTILAENLIISIPTSASDEIREEIEAARRPLYRREGDHLFLLSILRGYLKEKKADRKEWAQKHWISHRAMRNVLDVRKQLRNLCAQLISQPQDRNKPLHLFHADDDGEGLEEHISPDKAERVLKCFLSGFFHNTARLVPDGTYRTVTGNQTITIHPGSILFSDSLEPDSVGSSSARRRRKLEAIMYHDFVYTTRPFARCVSAVQLDWVMQASPVYLMHTRRT